MGMRMFNTAGHTMQGTEKHFTGPVILWKLVASQRDDATLTHCILGSDRGFSHQQDLGTIENSKEHAQN